MDVAPPPTWPPPIGRARHVTVHHALVVCTANVCRSPVVEQLLQRCLDGIVADVGGRWEVRSAGTASIQAAPDARTLRAARAVGLDLDRHVSRRIDHHILRRDGADLVLTMERAHLRAVIAMDRSAWPRTFTLKELVRRTAALPSTAAEGSFDGWLSAVGRGRVTSALMVPDPADEVADPYGRPQPAHDAMVAEVSGLVNELGRLGPWRQSWALGGSGARRPRPAGGQ